MTINPGEPPRDEDAYLPPFLRITGSYPAPGDRLQTVSLEVNVDALEEGVDSDWLTDFAIKVVDAMHGAAPAGAVTYNFANTTLDPNRLHEIFAARERAGAYRDPDQPTLFPTDNNPEAAASAEPAGQTEGN